MPKERLRKLAELKKQRDELNETIKTLEHHEAERARRKSARWDDLKEEDQILKAKELEEDRKDEREEKQREENQRRYRAQVEEEARTSEYAYGTEKWKEWCEEDRDL
jgi:hypothetical protein